jgi:hypothetical protein
MRRRELPKTFRMSLSRLRVPAGAARNGKNLRTPAGQNSTARFLRISEYFRNLRRHPIAVTCVYLRMPDPGELEQPETQPCAQAEGFADGGFHVRFVDW